MYFGQVLTNEALNSSFQELSVRQLVTSFASLLPASWNVCVTTGPVQPHWTTFASLMMQIKTTRSKRDGLGCLRTLWSRATIPVLDGLSSGFQRKEKDILPYLSHCYFVSLTTEPDPNWGTMLWLSRSPQ